MSSIKMVPLFFIFCFIGVESVKKLPSYVEQCYRNDPDLSACLLRNVQNLQPMFQNGIPELLIPDLSPLRIPSATLSTTGSLQLDLTDIKLYHVGNFTLKYFNFYYEKKNWDLELFVPSVGMVSDYKMKGKLMIFELDSTGEVKANMTDMTVKYSGTFDLVQHNSKEHFAIKNSQVKSTIEKFQMEYSNMFGNNTELNDNANKIINQNYKSILQEISGVLEEMMRGVVDNALQNLFNKYPADVLLPEKIL